MLVIYVFISEYNSKKTNVFVQQEQWKLAYTAAARKRLMKWKVFESDRAARQQEKQIDNLHRKIGELEVELDFAKRASRALGIGLPAKD